MHPSGSSHFDSLSKARLDVWEKRFSHGRANFLHFLVEKPPHLLHVTMPFTEKRTCELCGTVDPIWGACHAGIGTIDLLSSKGTDMHLDFNQFLAFAEVLDTDPQQSRHLQVCPTNSMLCVDASTQSLKVGAGCLGRGLRFSYLDFSVRETITRTILLCTFCTSMAWCTTPEVLLFSCWAA